MQRPLWVRWLLMQGYSVVQCDLDIVWLHDPLPLLRNAKLPHARMADKLLAKAAAKSGKRHPIDYDKIRIPTSEHVLSSRYAATAAAEAAEAVAAAEIKSGAIKAASLEPHNVAAAAGHAREPWRVPDMLFQSEQAYGLNGGFYFARPTNNTLTFYAEWVRRLSEMIASPSFEEQHALNSALRRVKAGGCTGGCTLMYDHLHERQFPNGKIWWSCTCEDAARLAPPTI